MQLYIKPEPLSMVLYPNASFQGFHIDVYNQIKTTTTTQFYMKDNKIDDEIIFIRNRIRITRMLKGGQDIHLKENEGNLNKRQTSSTTSKQ